LNPPEAEYCLRWAAAALRLAELLERLAKMEKLYKKIMRERLEVEGLLQPVHLLDFFFRFAFFLFGLAPQEFQGKPQGL